MPVNKRGVGSLAKSGSTKLKGDITLTGGTNVTLTQSGQDISIAATGAGGISAVVDDTSPQLGGDLDTQGYVVTNSGGTVTMQGTDGNDAKVISGAAGQALFQGGNGNVSFPNAGDVQMLGGTPSTNGNGGDILVQATAGNGAGTDGKIRLTTSGFEARIDTTNLSADRAVSFPDKAGTLAMTSDLPTALTDLDTTVTGSQLNTLYANTSGTNTGDQTTVSGNAGTATALQTSRTIGTLTGDVTSAGSSFDGTANNTNSTTVTKINGTSLAGLATGILKNTTSTGVPSIAVAGDFPTLNQNTTGSAATLTTPRAIYGNNFDGSAALTQIIASTYGGTGNGFTKFSGPTTSEKTFTLPNSSATLLYSGGALGTPSSGTLTNATGLPLTTGVTGTLPVANGGTGVTTTAALAAAVGALLYPVGSYYINETDSTNPGTLLGFGTWTAVQNRMIVGKGSGTFATAGSTGGAETHTLTTAEMPTHTHSYGAGAAFAYYVGSGGGAGLAAGSNITTGTTTASAGSGAAHNIMNPYIVAYIWKRTA